MSAALVLAHAGVAHGDGGWAFSATATAYLAALCAVYLGLVLHRRRRGGGVSRARAGAWLAGVAVVGLALMSPIDTLAAERSLTMHTVQHELLLTVAPILLLLGLGPGLVAPVARRLVLPALRRRGTATALRISTGPVLAVACWTVVVAGGALPVTVELAWRDEAAHYATHAASLVAGLLLWAVVLSPYPSVRPLGAAGKLACVAGANVVAGLVAGVLAFVPSVAYPLPYGTAERPWLGLDPLTDQRLAAGVMMASCMISTLAAAVWVVSRAPARVVEGWQGLVADAPTGDAGGERVAAVASSPRPHATAVAELSETAGRA